MIYEFNFSFFNQVSWVRYRDVHILAVGSALFTSDQRFLSKYNEDEGRWEQGNEKKSVAAFYLKIIASYSIISIAIFEKSFFITVVVYPPIHDRTSSHETNFQLHFFTNFQGALLALPKVPQSVGNQELG